ncbi:hypothetical protein OSB04_000142 [Centaurea solstitialis]|uniref:50S ribosomal protein L13, chloroplastic n=1 Tax=Centaurea solstitialis TaxID=347529 RepID=A0AA38TZ12_9ASTR|nr:hypothetical protein OSB04_000142 [Centaurea solstitialis]
MSQSFSGNLKIYIIFLINFLLQKAVAGIRRINLDGLRWRVFDAKGQVLGRLASQISTVVQGKDKPTYTPNRDDGDMCIVLNAKDICVTGRKLTDKYYRWHTGQVSSLTPFLLQLNFKVAEWLLACASYRYIGHLKERSLKDQMAKDPTEVIRKAVLRMLPRNKLRDDRDRKLRIFAGGEHPFGDKPLEPYVMPPRQVREMRPRARRAMVRAQKKTEQQEGGQNISKGKKREDQAVSNT